MANPSVAMKMRKQLIVSLARQVIELLEALRPITRIQRESQLARAERNTVGAAQPAAAVNGAAQDDPGVADYIDKPRSTASHRLDRRSLLIVPHSARRGCCRRPHPGSCGSCRNRLIWPVLGSDQHEEQAMRELILGMSVSLDGFVSGPDGEAKWIFSGDQEAIATLKPDSFNPARKVGRRPTWPAAIWPMKSPN